MSSEIIVTRRGIIQVINPAIMYLQYRMCPICPNADHLYLDCAVTMRCMYCFAVGDQWNDHWGDYCSRNAGRFGTFIPRIASAPATTDRTF